MGPKPVSAMARGAALGKGKNGSGAVILACPSEPRSSHNGYGLEPKWLRTLLEEGRSERHESTKTKRNPSGNTAPERKLPASVMLSAPRSGKSTKTLRGNSKDQV